MRCICCDKKLTDYESTLKHAVTSNYLDTCLGCLSEIAQDVPMPVQARKDLVHSEVFEGELDTLDEVEYNKYLKGTSED